MKKDLLLFLILTSPCCSSCANSTESEAEAISSGTTDTVVQKHKLANASATVAAKKVYNILWSLYGSKIVSGTVANVDWNIKEAENVHGWTERWPALNVFDFINIHASKDVNPNGWLDYSDMSVVENWWNAGGLVGCMWHWQTKANNGTNWTCSPGTNPGETSMDAACIENPSSPDCQQLVHDIDQVAGYLKSMQKKGIAVIWRPLHEAAGNTYEYEGGKAWFWWGAKGADAYKKLWRFLYDRLVNYHKLNNLIWVWNSQMGDSLWYPGDDVVDVIGRDSYYALQYPLMKEYRQLQNEYPDKLVALAECGNGDEVKMSSLGNIWQEGSRWSWFMTWYDYDYNAGKSEEHKFADKSWWTEAFATGVVVDRDEIRKLMNQ